MVVPSRPVVVHVPSTPHRRDPGKARQAREVAKLVSAAGFDVLAEGVRRHPCSNTLRDAANSLAYHVATGRGTTVKEAALVAVVDLATRLGCDRRIRRVIDRAQEQAARVCRPCGAAGAAEGDQDGRT